MAKKNCKTNTRMTIEYQHSLEYIRSIGHIMCSQHTPLFKEISNLVHKLNNMQLKINSCALVKIDIKEDYE
jgi:hypothetical protein